jgi:uncharacterized protein with FMN-binding domain
MRFFCIIGIVAVLIMMAACNSTKLSEIEAVLPDMQYKSDGIYRGSYDLSGTPVKVTLDVIIQRGNISGINIVQHFCSPIGKKAEKIVDIIIQEQSLSVDAISGATASSKAILKAVEDALH